MANIDIKDLKTLNLDGNDLFAGLESFMVELSDDDQQFVLGGCPNHNDTQPTFTLPDYDECHNTNYY